MPHEEKPVFPTTYDAGDDYEEKATSSGCGFFQRFCFGWNEEESNNYLLQENKEGAHHKDAWLVARIKKLREFTEMVAGPKWKNLIRRRGKIYNSRKQDKIAVQFQYSPESYALNFAGDDQEEDGILMHSFSTRFVPSFFINDPQRRPAM